jgi:hypothetical protein
MLRSVMLVSLGVLGVGCADRATMFPSSDPQLNRPAEEFRILASERFPYPSDLPRGGILEDARAELGYELNQITLSNFSGQTWEDAELWINEGYVVLLPRVESGQLMRVSFKMLYNEVGRHFPLNGQRIDVVELKLHGKLYELRRQLG